VDTTDRLGKTEQEIRGYHSPERFARWGLTEVCFLRQTRAARGGQGTTHADTGMKYAKITVRIPEDWVKQLRKLSKVLQKNKGLSQATLSTVLRMVVHRGLQDFPADSATLFHVPACETQTPRTAGPTAKRSSRAESKKKFE